MQMYKIITLGEIFLFSIEKGKSKEPFYRDEEGHLVHLFIDTADDYVIEIENFDDIYIPDLYRALMTYIYRVNGFPNAEYEIKILNNGTRVILPDISGKIGGNVGKCKLLFSNTNKNIKINGLDMYEIWTKKGNYFIIECDNIAAFDTKKLLSRIYSEGLKLCDINALILFSRETDEVNFDITFLPEKKLGISSSAFAALFYLISSLEGCSHKKILCNAWSASCEKTEDGIFVFDNAPRAYKLL